MNGPSICGTHLVNRRYGHKPGFKVYTHISDRYGPFYTKLIAATASEALHVLDGHCQLNLRRPALWQFQPLAGEEIGPKETPADPRSNENCANPFWLPLS